VAKLNGMFAFSLYDTKRRRLLLARDHFGIKPLVYAETPEGIFWGSEVKSVLVGAGIKARTNAESVSEYLAFRYRAGEPTFFEGVRRLPPAHYAVWTDGKMEVTQYWTMPKPNGHVESADAVVERLTKELSGATTAQLVADVPLGAFCSGGLDSGLITGFATQARAQRMHTFSVGFTNPAWDESALARANAERFGTEHHVITLEADEFIDTIRSTIWHHDEPLSHPNTIPFVSLSRLAREHVKVVLTGEGSDELFGGYPRYHIARLNHAARGWPSPPRSALGGLLSLLPDHRAKRAGDLLAFPYEDALIFNSAYSDPRAVERLTGAAVPLAERRRLFGESVVEGDPVATLGRLELRTYLSCLLDRMDRATMAASLEARVPFLDVPLAEWALTLSSSHKLNGKQNKAVVRELARRMLAPEVASARKSGFGLPIGDWLRNKASGLVDSLRDPAHPAAEHFNRQALNTTVDRFRAGAPIDDLMWLIVNVYLWHEVHAG
jgi:asparagine synthase (glutamine-hydrolysing)